MFASPHRFLTENSRWVPLYCVGLKINFRGAAGAYVEIQMINFVC